MGKLEEELHDEEIDVEKELKEKEKELYEVRKDRGFKKKREDIREESNQNRGMKQERRKFCHFWNNGRCKYRDSECWFLHEESPECRFGRECTVRRCMFYHPQRENWYLNEGKQHVNRNQRENWSSSKGKQNNNSPQRENWYSSQEKQHVNHQQRENWPVNRGNPWNCLTSGVKRRGNNWM